MIICSCNVLRDAEIRSIVATASTRPTISQVYAGLGCQAKCGRCASSIKQIRDEMSRATSAGM